MSRDEELAATIDDFAREQFLPQGPGCTIAAVRDGTVVFRGAYGMAHIELGVSMRPEFRLRLASITKQFIAVALLKLRDAGRLSLDDDFRRWLPEWRAGIPAITLAHMLSHTSGLKVYEGGNDQALLPLYFMGKNPYELVSATKDDVPDCAPGERYTYNNYAYVLLGLVIERVAGMPLIDYLQRELFDPAGMTNTLFDDPALLLPGRVEGYQLGSAGIERAPYINMRVIGGAGGLISNVDDLARWYIALLDGSVVSRASLDEAWADHTLAGGQTIRYGYGWGLGSYDGERFIEHGGQVNGFYNHAVCFPDQRIAVIVLSNLLPRFPAPEWLSVRSAALLLGKPYREPDRIPQPPEDLQAFEGVYASDDGAQAVLRVQGERLWLRRGPLPWMELVPTGKGVLAMPRSFLRLQGEPGRLVSSSATGGRMAVWQRIAEPLPADVPPAV
ncbi:MAG: beta-lactamase family protein [Chloroflexi bacterium]|nr:beta-lactamase family protein [Chloroflexota bacterium]